MTDTTKPLRDALEAGPTDGPWHWDGNVWDYNTDQDAPWLADASGNPILSGEIHCQIEADALYIAAANPATIRALLARLDAAEADARRYLWLRDQPTDVPAGGPDLTIWDGRGGGDALRGIEADSAIDAALTKGA